jgi:hypothetical protein
LVFVMAISQVKGFRANIAESFVLAG